MTFELEDKGVLIQVFVTAVWYHTKCGCNWIVSRLHVIHLQARALIFHVDPDQRRSAYELQLETLGQYWKSRCGVVVISLYPDWISAMFFSISLCVNIKRALPVSRLPAFPFRRSFGVPLTARVTGHGGWRRPLSMAMAGPWPGTRSTQSPVTSWGSFPHWAQIGIRYAVSGVMCTRLFPFGTVELPCPLQQQQSWWSRWPGGSLRRGTWLTSAVDAQRQAAAWFYFTAEPGQSPGADTLGISQWSQSHTVIFTRWSQ